MAGNVERAMDELTLCRRISRGERHLFAQLIDRHSALVAGAIAAQGVAGSDAEDLAQLAFINAYKGLAGFRGEAKLSSWLYRIAVNVARAHLKRQSQRPFTASVEQQLEEGQQPLDERRGLAPAAELRSRELARAMEQLSEVQRVTLSLYYFEELSYEEIAAALRLNINTVRTHIRRGKLALSELLSAEVLDEL
jgi:RNA polymerase sigma-70 factor (ECF subfamily)